MTMVRGKVEYTPADGTGKRTAYIDSLSMDERLAVAEEKHTGKSVVLVRDEVGEPWSEAS